MGSRVTVAGITGCVLSEDGEKVVLSITSRRGQAIDLAFAAGDFAGLVPTLLATAALVSFGRQAAGERVADDLVWQLAAPATQLASRQLDGDVTALGFRLHGSAAELWLACQDEAKVKIAAHPTQ